MKNRQFRLKDLCWIRPEISQKKKRKNEFNKNKLNCLSSINILTFISKSLLSNRPIAFSSSCWLGLIAVVVAPNSPISNGSLISILPTPPEAVGLNGTLPNKSSFTPFCLLESLVAFGGGATVRKTTTTIKHQIDSTKKLITHEAEENWRRR